MTAPVLPRAANCSFDDVGCAFVDWAIAHLEPLAARRWLRQFLVCVAEDRWPGLHTPQGPHMGAVMRYATSRLNDLDR